MKILVEGCSYDPKELEGVLPEGKIMLTGDKVKIEHVGYFRSSECDDFVFFLPKVVLEPRKLAGGVEEDRVLCTTENPDGLAPEDIIDLDKAIEKGVGIGEREREFLYEFSVWIYRAIARYDETHPGNEVVWRRKEKKSGGFRRRYVTNTLLDVILALIRFNRDNQDYFTFRVKEKHSGYNKINWTRTISKTTAFIQDGTPLYLSPRTKKKVVNFDEELLVIFYSILDYINRHYSFKARFNLGYDLIPAAEFKRYLNGYGESRLRQIKYKYFSDRDLALWELCYAFFHKAHKANVVSEGEEYLIAKNFEIIFEAMIDELLGDKELSKLKELDDGKEIDHLYLDDSLTRSDGRKTFYIADSKYYKIGRGLEDRSIAKQFTYAKDMLQLNLDLFLPGDDASDKVKRWRELFNGKNIGLLRDPETEGYDVIPNFFISANMNKDFDYEKSELCLRGPNEGREYHSVHFHNRFFDRDTLILSHYDVNFLYVLKLYVGNDDGMRQGWKEDVKSKFRDHIRGLLERRFEFSAIMPHDGIDPSQFFKENLKATLGKVYSLGFKLGDKPIYMMALQKPKYIYFGDDLLSAEGNHKLFDKVTNENEETRELVGSAFYIEEVEHLGDIPVDKLLEQARLNPIVHAPASDAASGVQVLSGISGGLKKAVDASGLCPCPMSQCPDPNAIKVLVLPHTMGANLYQVVAGTLQSSVTLEDLNAETNDKFKSVKFPSLPLYVWQVTSL